MQTHFCQGILFSSQSESYTGYGKSNSLFLTSYNSFLVKILVKKILDGELLFNHPVLLFV